MAERKEKETVVVHDRDPADEPHSSSAAVWVLVAIIVIVLLFLLFGGLNIFNSSNPATSPSVPSPGVQVPSASPNSGAGGQ